MPVKERHLIERESDYWWRAMLALERRLLAILPLGLTLASG
jgi:hypothetical protein